jgi:hypothetical protein
VKKKHERSVKCNDASSYGTELSVAEPPLDSKWDRRAVFVRLGSSCCGCNTQYITLYLNDAKRLGTMLLAAAKRKEK